MGDLKNRITRARNTFTKLGKIWNNNKITRKNKIKLFKTLVTLVLLYGCKTWKMNTFQNKCLRKILEIRWEDHVSNKEINERSGIKPVSQETCRRRWKYYRAHVKEGPRE